MKKESIKSSHVLEAQGDTMKTHFSDIIILGGGPGGIAAAIWSERLSLSWRLFEKKSQLGGQLSMIHTPIPDYPGMIYSDGAELRTALEKHLHALNSQNIHTSQHVVSIQSTSDHISISTAQNETFHAATLILASGVQRRRLRLPYINKFLQKGVSYTASGAIENFRQRATAIIGGGDGALENALKLSHICPKVHLIFRNNKPTARNHFIEAAQNRNNIIFHANSTLHNITGEKWMEEIAIQSPNGITKHAAFALLIKVGFEPSSHILGLDLAKNSSGHIITSPTQKSTNPRIWAIGDVCSPLDPSLSLAVGQASVATRDIERFLHNDAKIGIC